MKLVKALLITLSAVLLTGCYTQLQYSQGMHRVTDQRKADPAAQQQNEQHQEYEEDEYIPVYYKDYEYAQRWSDCRCNIYSTYNFNRYDSYDNWYGHSYHPYRFHSYHSWSPYYRWKLRHQFGHRFYGSSFGFSLHWGSPYYDPFFYDPYYYGAFAHGFSPWSRNYFIFYGQPGSGYYGGIPGNKGVIDRNRSYRPRSIGTSRVSGNSTRSREATVGRQGVTRNKSAIRTRANGTTRSRGAINNTRRSSSSSGRATGRSVSRSRDGASSTSVRSNSRSRGNIQGQSDHRQPASQLRSRNLQETSDNQQQSRIIRYRSLNQNWNSRQAENNSRIIRNRLRSQMAPEVKSNYRQRSRSSFFDRMRGFLESSGKQIINSANNSGRIRLRSRSSSTNRSSINRSSRSQSRSSSVTRSRSSSNNRSGSSSRSRSRSGSSGSDRSRGN